MDLAVNAIIKAENLDVTDEEKALMKGGNAARIFNL